MSGPKAFVIGHPVAHSRSPLIHGHWLRHLGIDGSYERIHVPPDDLDRFLRDLPASGFAGGNVTIPHKEGAFRAAAVVTERARRLGAANTLWLEDGLLHGDNTDGHGFVAGLAESVGAEEARALRTALVIGAGGAARAIVPALLDLGLGTVAVCARDPGKARPLAAGTAAVDVRPWSELPEALAGADLVVNTTQLGMTGQDPLDIDLAGLGGRAVVADIVYVPLETPLLAAARARGLRTVDGLGMLLHQAVPGFARWFGRVPTVTPELRALVEADLGRAP